ncbi:DUF7336 domain-containing protein [Lederbergia lenta]|uniref:DUF7336 domain-containing protein n=1 Tax=Lederbergia lenta TaxID=1467 RepID=UPI00203FB79D|nr:hypothetical protein [Lederbergia lenta]MCM3109969.1 hypothetical protein [Lederbergia lenta]
MKLYLLYVSYPYEGGYVYGIYSSIEEAKKYLNDDYLISPGNADIKEITVDEFTQITI